MPAKSKAQARFMGAICGGARKPPKGMTKEQACEYIRGQKIKSLPEKARKKKK